MNPKVWTGTSGLTGATVHATVWLDLAEPADQERVQTLLADAGFSVVQPGSGEVAGTAVAVIDLRKAPSKGLEPVHEVMGMVDGPRMLIVVDEETLALGRQALGEGAWAVLIAPIQDDAFLTRVRHAVGDWHKSRQLLLHEEIVSAVHDVILAVDADGQVAFLNEAAATWLQVDAADVVGQEVAALLSATVPDQPDSADVVEYWIEHEDMTFWIRGSWRAVGHRGDAPLVRLLVAREVTRERSLSQDLVRSGALAELGLMATEVAHEVNNPATYLMTNLSLLRDDLDAERFEPALAREMIEECLDGVIRITEIVRRMRSLATADSDVVSDEPIDVSSVVRDACRIAGLRVKYKADLHIHEPVFPTVRGAPRRLGQVVLNLVVNAADALSGQVDPMPRIDVSVGREEDWATIDVRDNGPGVSKALEQRIFEAFVSSKTDRGGTGLGLAVSRTIAAEHGGDLTLVAHDGRGAWFRLRLPLARTE